MIVREWRARARLSLAHAYPQHLTTHVLPQLTQISGFLDASLSQRRIAGLVELLVLIRWASLESIRAFARADIEKESWRARPRPPSPLSTATSVTTKSCTILHRAESSGRRFSQSQ